MTTSEIPADAGACPGATPGPGGLRCSDADRERTSAALHEAVGEGFLTLAEAEERLARAYAARHRHELHLLTADLPPEVTPTQGWRAILVLLGHQLAGDLRVLLGRDAAAGGRRRVLLAISALMALLILAGTVAAALHGVFEGGDHHGLVPGARGFGSG